MLGFRRKQPCLRTLSIAAALLAAAVPLAVLAAAPNAALPSPEIGSFVSQGVGLETAVLSGGCFWGVQGVFEHVAGVKRVLAGYAGGNKNTATYGQVSTGTTGHAETVEITFDPEKISFGQILRIFFSVALDPTELNRQGPDDGTQYRSEIFYNDESQREVAQAYIAQLDRAHIFTAPIVTRVDPNTGFFPAEDYHQDYLVHHPENMYIVFNDLPKVANLKRVFPETYLENPILALPTRSSAQ
jgi:peptide-methionine (S)-S-oxide reductase